MCFNVSTHTICGNYESYRILMQAMAQFFFIGWFLWENGNNIFSLAVTRAVLHGSTVKFASNSGMVEQSKCPNVARCTCCSVGPARWNLVTGWAIHPKTKPLVMTNIAMEAMALIEIDALPFLIAWWFSIATLNNQRAYQTLYHHPLNEGHICLKPPTSKKTIVAQRTSKSMQIWSWWQVNP